jgi:hypothetical protein
VLVICVIAALVSGVLLGRIKSPKQAALDSAPPSRSVLSAEVVEAEVTSELVGRATVEAAVSVAVDPVTPAGVSRAVISALPVDVGSEVAAGTVVAGVSGRPLIVLQGAVPAYRDIRIGDSGPDVEQLQEALAAVGYSLAIDGQYGTGTAAAVAELYRSLDSDPPVLEVEDRSALSEDVAADRSREDASEAETLRIESEADAGLGETPGEDGERASHRIEGGVFPMAEAVFLPSLPARLVEVQGKVGATIVIDAPLLRFSTNAVEIRQTLTPEQAATVAEGMTARLDADNGEWTGNGVVARVESGPKDEATGALALVAVIVPQEAVPGDLLGSSLKSVLVRQASEGAVLAVPASAILVGADQRPYVLRLKGDTSTRVAVTPGVVGDTLVEIADPEGALKAGDLVVVSS